jgi:biopolymer transport protein ExbD
MPLRTEPLEEPQINLTSMLDVVMLLIVFFMVGTKFSEEERQTNIQVPTASDNYTLSGEPDKIIINVTIDKEISVRNEAYTLDSLKTMLVAAREAYPGQGVVIRGDGRGELQSAVDVMSACTSAGIKSVSLSVKPKEN